MRCVCPIPTGEHAQHLTHTHTQTHTHTHTACGACAECPGGGAEPRPRAVRKLRPPGLSRGLPSASLPGWPAAMDSACLSVVG
eukprot:2809667-Prymnesium_polylepis.1